jgi:hypothetical protein
MNVEELKDSIKKNMADVGVVGVEWRAEDANNSTKHVLTLHGVMAGNTPVLMTKFVFWEKDGQVADTYSYLRDCPCVYRTKNMNSSEACIADMVDVLTECAFGDRLKDVSVLLTDFAVGVNQRLGVTKISVIDAAYVPRVLTKPCADTTYDFELSVSNGTKINVSVVPGSSVFDVLCSGSQSVKSTADDADGIMDAVASAVKSLAS